MGRRKKLGEPTLAGRLRNLLLGLLYLPWSPATNQVNPAVSRSAFDYYTIFVRSKEVKCLDSEAHVAVLSS